MRQIAARHIGMRRKFAVVAENLNTALAQALLYSLDIHQRLTEQYYPRQRVAGMGKDNRVQAYQSRDGHLLDD